MAQEHKELLFKDICTRLPYGVIVETPKGKGHVCDINLTIFGYEFGVNVNPTIRDNFSISYVKPYLFPLSSMTKEQLFEIQEIFGKNEIEIEDGFLHIIDSDRNTISYSEITTLLEWFYKNHFDINNLIAMKLAIDATGLNIY